MLSTVNTLVVFGILATVALMVKVLPVKAVTKPAPQYHTDR